MCGFCFLDVKQRNLSDLKWSCLKFDKYLLSTLSDVICVEVNDSADRAFLGRWAKKLQNGVSILFKPGRSKARKYKVKEDKHTHTQKRLFEENVLPRAPYIGWLLTNGNVLELFPEQQQIHSLILPSRSFYSLHCLVSVFLHVSI